MSKISYLLNKYKKPFFSDAESDDPGYRLSQEIVVGIWANNIFTYFSNDLNYLIPVHNNEYTLKSPGFLFCFGLDFEEIYNSFSEDVALFDFGYIQMLALSTDCTALSFNNLISDNKELILDRWHKVAVYGSRWTAFDNFLHQIKSENSPFRYMVLDNMFKCDDLIDVLCLMFSPFLTGYKPEVQLPFKKCEIDKEIDKEFFQTYFEIYSNDISRLFHPSSWESLFLGISVRDLFTRTKLQHSRFCRTMSSICEIFFNGLLPYTKPLKKSKNLNVLTPNQLRELCQSFLFAQAVRLQIEVALQDKKQLHDWCLEKSTELMKGLKSFFWLNEKRKNQIEQAVKVLRNVRLIKSSFKDNNDLKEREGVRFKTCPLPPCICAHVLPVIYQSASLFQALSVALFGSFELEEILKVVCLAEITKNYNNYWPRIKRFDYFLMKILLTFFQNMDPTFIDLTQIPNKSGFQTKHLFTHLEKTSEFPDLILEIVARVIEKNIIVYAISENPNLSFTAERKCMLVETLPFHKNVTPDSNETLQESVLSCRNLNPSCQCQIQEVSGTELVNFVSIAQQGLYWTGLPPKFFLRSLVCDQCNVYLHCQPHKCFESFRVFRQLCQTRFE